jgi:hypothetical protein
MATKTVSTFAVIIICILLLPVGIGICGGIFGLIAGLIGAIFGIIGGIFGALFGAIGVGMRWIFHNPFSIDLNLGVLLLIILVVVIASKKNKTS